jgi:hypothetical protein
MKLAPSFWHAFQEIHISVNALVLFKNLNHHLGIGPYVKQKPHIVMGA